MIGEPASVPSVMVVNAERAPFEEFFEAQYPRLCEALVLLTGDPFEAEELAQEAMTRVLERWERVGAMGSPAVAPSSASDDDDHVASRHGERVLLTMGRHAGYRRHQTTWNDT